MDHFLSARRSEQYKHMQVVGIKNWTCESGKGSWAQVH